MISILRALATVYSVITLFIMEILYQLVLSLINGTKYSVITLKNAVVDSFFEIVSDVLMLIIDLLQSIIEGINTGIIKARSIVVDFKQGMN